MKVKVIYPVRPDWNEFEQQVFDVGEINAKTPEQACEMMFKGFNVVVENPTREDPGYYNTVYDPRARKPTALAVG